MCLPAARGLAGHAHQAARLVSKQATKSQHWPTAGSTKGLASASVPHLSYPSSPPTGAPKCITSLTSQKPQLSPGITSLGPHSQRLAPCHSGAPKETGSQLRPQWSKAMQVPSQRGMGTHRSGPSPCPAHHTHPGHTSHR